MTFDAPTIVLITAMLLLAGVTKGIIGFGLPAVFMGLAGLIMSPSQAAALLVAPNIITNTQQGLLGPALRPLLKRLGLFLAALVAGALLYEWVTGGQDLPWAKRLLGVTLVIYAALGLLSIRFSITRANEAWSGLIAGVATGAMTIATGVFVIPSAPFLQAVGLEKDELVQAMGLTFLTASVTLGFVLLMRGSLGSGVGLVSAAAVIPAVAAMLAGQWLRSRISPDAFKRLFYLGMLALGATLAIRG
jgi:uncharacterized protein